MCRSVLALTLTTFLGPVTVPLIASDSVRFTEEIIPVLNRAGCNAGACHGTPNGKGGFKLSLRGYDIPTDYHALTREVGSRRIDRVDPDRSLILLKALNQVPHQGGKRFDIGSQEHTLLRKWIIQGAPNDPPEARTLIGLDLSPPSSVVRLDQQSTQHQLIVTARFSDGTTRDVTHLGAFSVSDEEFAEVTSHGVVIPRQRGEVAVLVRYLDQIVTARFLFLQDREGFVWPDLPRLNLIDEHIDPKLKQLQIPPSPICADHVFVRRAYLDSIGTLPTADEVRSFLTDSRTDKRARLIDQLLDRPEFADFWASKWADVLRVSERFMEPDGIRDFHGWIREWIAEDRPLDQFVRTMLLAEGSSRKSPPVGYYRSMPTPEEMAETTAQLFLGIRMQCARCHNHPFEKWTQDDFYGLAAVFAPVQVPTPRDRGVRDPATLKITRDATVSHPRTGQAVSPALPGGVSLPSPGQDDPRRPFVDWLTDAENPHFSRSLANRIWFHLMGRGLVEPIDDFRDSNPPAHPELLDVLASRLVADGWRLRPIIRLIMNSRAYQASAISHPLNRDDERYFSRAVTKLLTAEQLLDAVSMATGVPESFADEVNAAIRLPGAPSEHPFLKAFNRPARNLACECERDPDANLAQALQLISGELIQRKLAVSDSRAGRLTDAPDDDAIDEIYLSALSRHPSSRERAAVKRHLGDPATDRREVLEDVLWALLNSKEFQFRH